MDNDNDRTESFVPLTEGAKIGHYTIVSKIGAGGMGEVYLAEDTALKRQVALKFLPYHFVSDETAKARFTREAQAAAKLNHPNIVTIHEVSEYMNRPFFAMECCDGKPLRDIIKEIELSLDDTINLTIQICEGLEKAHQAGIVHRDIKPSNIIIDSDGRPRLLDFGLATVQGTEKLTQTGSTLGTIGYMSPEQIEVKDLDLRSDLFSLGVVLYEMITGRLPFKSDTDAGTLNSILNDTPEPLSRYKSNVPEPLQQIVTKLLEKNQSYRYQTAAGVLSDLKHLSSRALQARKPIDKWNRYVVPSALAIIIAIFLIWKFGFKDQTPNQLEGAKVMLAVLPFKNLGDPNDEYFADGITEEIMSRLSSIKELGVISSTSSFAYKGTSKTLPQIAKELNVEYILEGNIRWDKRGDIERVRITPQLIKVDEDIHIWSDNYDEQINDIFAIQTMIANNIAEALNIQLQESERQIIAAKPTNNIDAYHYYLRAKLEFSDFATEPADAVNSIKFLNKAIELDSTLVAAHALMVELYGITEYFSGSWYFESSDSAGQKARYHADIVSKLAKNTVDDFIARGNYNYYVLQDYQAAEKAFTKGLQLKPSNVELMTNLGYVRLRQGKTDEGLYNLKQACYLDPYSARRMFNTALFLWFDNRFVESEELLDRALLFSPNFLLLYDVKISNILALRADFDSVWTIIENCRGTIIKDDQFYAGMTQTYLYKERRFEEAANIDVTASLEWFRNIETYHLKQGNILKNNGELVKAQVHYDSLYILTKEKLAEIDDVAAIYIFNGLALANTGKIEEAIGIGEKGFALVSIEKDIVNYSIVAGYMAELYTVAGRFDDAITILERMMEIASWMNLFILKQEAEWDPLRDHPRFQALIEKYEKKENY